MDDYFSRLERIMEQKLDGDTLNLLSNKQEQHLIIEEEEESSCESIDSDESESLDVKVVVFQDMKKPSSNTTNSDYKQFMSSSISKINETKQKVKQTEQEEEQEKQDKRNDIELMQLLNSSKILEEYEQSGMGKNRHYLHATYENKKIKAPTNIRIGIERKQKQRLEKRIQEAKDLGLYNSTTKHLYKDERQKLKEKQKFKESFKRGLNGSIGKYKNGVLHISKKEIESVGNQSRGLGSVSNKAFNAIGGDHRKRPNSKKNKK